MKENFNNLVDGLPRLAKGNPMIAKFIQLLAVDTAQKPADAVKMDVRASDEWRNIEKGIDFFETFPEQKDRLTAPAASLRTTRSAFISTQLIVSHFPANGGVIFE